MHDRDTKKKLPHWSYLFNYVFLLNLDKRTDRLAYATAELKKYGIKFIRVSAVEDDNGAHGLYLTYKKILETIPDGSSALFLEDDNKFLLDPAPVMWKCIDQLLHNKEAWNVFYLGVNTHANFSHFSAKNILPITKEVDGRSTHAIGFSSNGIKLLREALTEGEPVDMSIVKNIQHKHGGCFCSYPMIATQRAGYSDIDKKVDDMSYIEERFNDHVKHLL